MKDEIVGKALPTDSEIKLRYTLKNSDGSILASNVTVELDNVVVQEGDAWNKANVLPDDTVNYLKLNELANPLPKDAFNSLQRQTDAYTKVGEIRTLSNEGDTLGDDYLLCDGSIVFNTDYPLLSGKVTDIDRWNEMSGSINSSGSSFENSFNAVAYGNGRWVTVGNNGLSYYSTDGFNLVAMTGLPTTYDFNAIAYGNGRWVTVDSYRSAYYSTNGTSWIAMTGTATAKQFRDVLFADSRFIAVDSYGHAYYSTNGTSWIAMSGTTVTNLTTGLFAIAYGDGRWVTVGANGKAYYSTNGTSWIAMSGLTGGRDFYDVAYGNGRWVTVGEYGVSEYSTNGTTWTNMSGQTTSSNSDYTIWTVAYGNGRWVAGGGRDARYYSTDGTTWTDSGGGGGIYDQNTIVFANGIFVVGGNDSSLYYSTDGTGWTIMDKDRTNADTTAISYNPDTDTWVAVDNYGTAFSYKSGLNLVLPTLLDEDNQIYGYIRALDGTEDD